MGHLAVPGLPARRRWRSVLPLGLAALAACADARNPRSTSSTAADTVEARAFAAANGAAERRGDTLRIVGTGRVTAVLVDDTTEGDGYRILRYDGRIAGSPFHGVRQGFHEGRGYLLVHERTARQVRVDARPVASPSGRWLATVSLDLEAAFDPNALGILAPDADSVTSVYRVEPTRWGPDSIVWRGDDTLVVVQRWTTDSGPGKYERREARVVHEGAGWILQPPDFTTGSDGP